MAQKNTENVFIKRFAMKTNLLEPPPKGVVVAQSIEMLYHHVVINTWKPHKRKEWARSSVQQQLKHIPRVMHTYTNAIIKHWLSYLIEAVQNNLSPLSQK